MNKKICIECREEKDILEFYCKDKIANRFEEKCKLCRRQANYDKYHSDENFRIKKLARDKEYNKTHKRKRDCRENNRNSVKRAKNQVFTILGHKCVCCGETTKEFLSLDHILGRGGKIRRGKRGKGRAYWTEILKEGVPKDKYRTLCFNCNLSRGFLGYCPHEINKQGVL